MTDTATPSGDTGGFSRRRTGSFWATGTLLPLRAGNNKTDILRYLP